MKQIKWFLVLGALVSALAGAVWAALDTSLNHYVVLMEPTVIAGQSNILVGSGTDVGKYKGIAELVIVDSGDLSAVAATGTVYLQHSQVTNTPGYSNVTGKYFNFTGTGKVNTVKIDLGTVYRYLRIKVVNVSATGGLTAVGGVLVCPPGDY